MKSLTSIKLTDIEKIYIGRNSGCRCGCHGKYIYVADNEIRAKSLFTRARNLVYSGDAEIDENCDSYMNISFGNDRAICIYLT